jgi:hypothetical protein
MTEQQIAQIFVQLGFAAIFLYMLSKLWSDYKALQAQLEEIRQQHIDDLRDVSGIRQHLWTTQATVTQWRNSPDMLADTQHTRPKDEK